jgi:catechol 2,3-dioxygenase-like lactoylglutathione lyase family enzyme
MTTTKTSTDQATAARRDAPTDFKLEVVLLPVTDVDRAKAFYSSIGWREDADIDGGDLRVVQFTPPGSDASIIFGKGVAAVAGPLEGLVLAVDDIDAAREELIAHDVYVSDVFHYSRGAFTVEERLPGPAPEHASYFSFATFSDPDGNVWQMQEIKTRLPGRVAGKTTFGSAADLTRALKRAEAAHGEYEASLGHRHDDWAPWYADYLVREQSGEELPA